MLDTTLATIMSSDLITLRPDDNMDKVDELFRMNNIHHLPVVDESEKLVGMISKSDYLHLCDSMSLFTKKMEVERNHRLFRSILVEDVMSRQVACLSSTDTVRLAAGFFRENLFHAIPIVDEKEKLVGIVTTFDMLNFAFREPALIWKADKEN